MITLVPVLVEINKLNNINYLQSNLSIFRYISTFTNLTNQMVFSLAMLTGTQVAKGHASKCFQPFLLPKDLKGKPEQLKNKLLVDFDPSRCFIRDLEVSTVKMTWC